MTPERHLLLRARAYWSTGQDLPTALFNEFLLAGLDVDREKDLFMSLLDD